METPIIHTRGLTKTYGKTDVVHDLNLEVQPGVVHGLLGPNGSGKSTTMKMLLGLIAPTGGEITMLGQPITRANRAKVLSGVGSLIEAPAAYPHLTGGENMRVVTRLLGVDEERARRAVRLVRLENHMDKLVKNYSLGMKQRLGIAMALARDPQLLILDEPTNGLDPAGIEEIRELIISLARDHGRTVLVSSHLLSEIEKMATDLTIINHGELVFQGSQDELYSAQLPDVFIQTLTRMRPPRCCGRFTPPSSMAACSFPGLATPRSPRLAPTSSPTAFRCTRWCASGAPWKTSSSA